MVAATMYLGMYIVSQVEYAELSQSNSPDDFVEEENDCWLFIILYLFFV